MNLGMAMAILTDRTLRRRVLSTFLILLLAMFASGLWLFDHWLEKNLWRFVIWWGACAVLAVFIFLFALYDAMAVVREERERFQRRKHGLDPDSPCDDE
jgi:polyferredoxin